MGKILRLEGKPDGMSDPDSAAEHRWGLIGKSFRNFYRKEALEEPSRAGGQSVTCTLALLL